MRGTTFRWEFSAALFLATLYSATSHGQSVQWNRQYGTSLGDSGQSVSVDSLGNVYTGGRTEGAITGTNAGAFDAFLRKYDSAGNVSWSRQFGSTENDGIESVSTDGTGNVFATGFAGGDLGGTGSGQIFVSKFDSLGNRLWLRQIGSLYPEGSTAISADHSGGVYITGFTGGALAGSPINFPYYDAFLIKYNDAGNQVWARKIGAARDDSAYGVAADTLGNVFIGGQTYGNLGRTNPNDAFYDAFISKYNSAGNLQWTRQFGGTTDDLIFGIATDNAGNVYATGYTQGNFAAPNAGPFDVFLTKYDTNGNQLWARQLGTSTDDESYAVSTDVLGYVYIAGMSLGDFGGTNAGGRDSFIFKFDASGSLVWKKQFGSAEDDESYGVAADGLGNVYVAGDTGGQWPIVPRHEVDASLTKIATVPEPNLSWILLVALGHLSALRRRTKHSI